VGVCRRQGKRDKREKGREQMGERNAGEKKKQPEPNARRERGVQIKEPSFGGRGIGGGGRRNWTDKGGVVQTKNFNRGRGRGPEGGESEKTGGWQGKAAKDCVVTVLRTGEGEDETCSEAWSVLRKQGSERWLGV